MSYIPLSHYIGSYPHVFVSPAFYARFHPAGVDASAAGAGGERSERRYDRLMTSRLTLRERRRRSARSCARTHQRIITFGRRASARRVVSSESAAEAEGG